MAVPLRLLILEDQPADAELLVHELRHHGFEPDWRLVATEADYLAHLDPSLELILADYTLPGFDGLSALHLMRGRDLDIPFIIVSGSIGEEVAVAAMKEGAADYLLKDRLVRLGPAVARAIEERGQRSERARAEAALRDAEARYRILFEQSPYGVLLVDPDTGMAIEMNDIAYQQLGYTREEFAALRIPDYEASEKPEETRQHMQKVIREGSDEFETLHRTKSGEIRNVHVWAKKVPFGKRFLFYAIFQDITEQSKLQSQLLQAQKMESVGQLGAGIAHDFNNILTAIIGYGTFLQMRLKDGDPLKHSADQILASAERAARLTQSLLAFSRKQIINPKPVDLNELIRALVKFLTRIIGEDIELRTVPAEGGLFVTADSGQIEQIIMNLATNARDAMPRGGLITISTSRLSLDPEFTKAHGYGEPGPYALISFEDTGVGMDKNTQEQIFDPFFTTKEVGKGTGLGLAIVYGIVKQHNGYVSVYSEQGMGTTFRIYLPITRSAIEEARKREDGAPASGSETVLLGEDDPGVRDLAKMILEQSGYTVIEAMDGEEAVAKFMENRERIELLLLDIVMPKKSGKAVADEIMKVSPGVRVLFTSGYTANIIHQNGILEEGLNFITKPFSPRDLLRKMREVLDQ